MGRDGIIFATPGLTFGILVKGSRGRVACANACSHARKRSDGHYSLGSDAGACIYLLSITRQGHGDDGEQQQEYVLSKSLDSSRRPLNILTSGHSLIPVTSAARQSRQGTSLRETADISGERCNEVHLHRMLTSVASMKHTRFVKLFVHVAFARDLSSMYALGSSLCPIAFPGSLWAQRVHVQCNLIEHFWNVHEDACHQMCPAV
jgi:hypothetical protein